MATDAQQLKQLDFKRLKHKHYTIECRKCGKKLYTKDYSTRYWHARGHFDLFGNRIY